MEMEVWVGEMRSDEPGSAGGGDAGVGGCECQWLKVQWLVVAMEVWWSGRACLHSHLFHATERRSRPKAGSLGRGRAPVSSQSQDSESPAMSYQKDIEVIHLIFRKDTDQKPPSSVTEPS